MQSIPAPVCLVPASLVDMLYERSLGDLVLLIHDNRKVHPVAADLKLLET
jgi:hypothetical protein